MQKVILIININGIELKGYMDRMQEIIFLLTNHYKVPPTIIGQLMADLGVFSIDETRISSEVPYSDEDKLYFRAEFNKIVK